jgi:ribosomal protein S18 acetylase RimI-like enzyme
MTIKYRSAEKGDSFRIAELISIASDGVVAHLFHDLVPEMSPVQLIAYNLEQNNSPHSYQNATVAVDGPKVIGMALSYPSSYHEITDEMRTFFPKERLDHLSDFYSSRVQDSWYLDALGVDEVYRRKGIGRRLVESTQKTAKKNGYEVLSLIVFADNSTALGLYRDLGFQVVKEVILEGNEFIPHQEGCLLLKCDLNS